MVSPGNSVGKKYNYGAKLEYFVGRRSGSTFRDSNISHLYLKGYKESSVQKPA
jgi:hypothetical protein